MDAGLRVDRAGTDKSCSQDEALVFGACVGVTRWESSHPLLLTACPNCGINLACKRDIVFQLSHVLYPSSPST